ncbi:photosystem II 12 kDa extrinsic protein [Tribonema minus]|uniref:Photosystem II 12 kDa extrinsic protein n=1 Tax=Tribonema minus TaxID=303371 RepID=A0A836CCI8_9STRA|nr:photosystem II 12 kDa extrinsic protein [Tribonema minus]
MKVTGAIVLAAACGAQAFVAPSAGVRSTQLSMTAQPVDRMAFLKSAATAAVVAVSVAAPALAEIDNPVVPFLGGGDKVDLNNANVRAYIKMPGMYPTVAGKVVSNGPYATVADVYNIKGLSEKEKSVLKKYESRFVTLEPQVMYGIDRINNGLYR